MPQKEVARMDPLLVQKVIEYSIWYIHLSVTEYTIVVPNRRCWESLRDSKYDDAQKSAWHLRAMRKRKFA